MKTFVIVVTQEQRLRFRRMKKEHGLLHDKADKKSYAIVNRSQIEKPATQVESGFKYPQRSRDSAPEISLSSESAASRI